MIESLTWLLAAQLFGEAVVRGLGLAFPGPVVGLAVMAAGIAWRGISPALHETAHGLLRNLALLFVPAGVGIIAQGPALATYLPALILAVLTSTVAALAVTALTFRWASRRFGGDESDQ